MSASTASTPFVRWACAAWIAVSASIASAAVTDTQAAERARIRQERAAAEASFAARERECRTRFIVTACVDDARQARRETLSRLRREESVLEDEVRKQKTADRVRELEENREREQARQREVAASPERRDAERAAGAPQARVRPPKEVPSSPAASAPVVNRSAEEARNRAAFEARRDAADAHRQKIEQRNAERAARGKATQPLPTPSAASAP